MKRRLPRRRGAWSVVLAAVMVAAGAGGFLLLSGDDDAPIAVQTEPPEMSTPSLPARVCQNSINRDCGPFEWAVSPQANRPMDIKIVVSPESPRAGQQVAFSIRIRDDASLLRLDPEEAEQLRADGGELAVCNTFVGFGDGKIAPGCDATGHCTAFGRWSPPQKGNEDYSATIHHTYEQPGRYTVIVRAKTSAMCDDTRDPYGETKEVRIEVEVR